MPRFADAVTTSEEMGIKDLLRFMKPHVEPIHISNYAGKRVGIDAYSWLHKGAYSCSMEICLNKDGDKKFQYLNYFMHRIHMLRHHNVTPVVVFDGGNIPSKGDTENERWRKRKANRELAMEKLKEGNINAASDLFQRAVSITPSMAHQLIQILRSENIEFVVAPYEADAQLAYLSSLDAEDGGIAAVISEDSDLLAYGCPAVIFKMDKFGKADEIVLRKVFNSANAVPSFQKFDMKLFTGMCILAGCDFLPSVPGIGIAKAYALVSKYRNLDRALSVLKFEKKNIVPEDYSKSFMEAIAVFQHALIYDVNSKILKHLNPIPEEVLQSLDEDLDFLGPVLPQSVAIAIAEGRLDPITMKAFDHSSHVRLPPSTTIVRTSAQNLRVKATPASTQESCFSSISSIRSLKEKRKDSVTKQKPVKEEYKYLNEAKELQKLICPLKSEVKEEEFRTPANNVVLKVPDNNPFRKRKHEEVQLESLDETETYTEEVFEVTEVNCPEISCVTPESQKSVDSKPVTGGKRRANIDKQKENDGQSSGKQNGSILSYFSRV